jgi:uncharacterized protein
MCYHPKWMGETGVVDTSVFVGALIGRAGHSRQVVRACLEGRLHPLMGQALFLEYEEVLGRDPLFRTSPLTKTERHELFEAFLSVCEWVHVYFTWRPNLPDEADNHVLELAIAGGATMIVTSNVRDFRGGELRFPGLRIVTPRELVGELL